MVKSASQWVVYLLGKPLTVRVEYGVWKQVALRDDELVVVLAQVNHQARVLELLNDWLMEQARRELPLILQSVIDLHGWRIRNPHVELKMRHGSGGEGLKLSVRQMRTRWGSCSRQGNLSLNSELLHLPRELIEYVIVHELCHLVHFGHTAAFWFQVASCLPNWRESRAGLKEWQGRVGVVKLVAKN